MAANKADAIASLRSAAEYLGISVSELRRDAYKTVPREARNGLGSGSVVRHFGSWGGAIQAAAPLPSPPNVPREERVTSVESSPFVLPDPLGRRQEPEQQTAPAKERPTRDLGRLLIIPDAHAHSRHDNRRFDWLAGLIAEERPEHIVCVGDWWDLPSVCKHSSRAALEGHRLAADLEVGWDAMRRLSRGWADYEPRRHMCLGNHEDRLDGLWAESPALGGALPDTKYLTHGLECFGWTVSRFKETVDVCGYATSHYLPSGVMGRPVGGVNQGRSLQTKGFVSAIVGHSHVRSEYQSTDYLGDRLQSINAGYYGHEDSVEGWNRNTHQLWWSGVAMVRLESVARGRGFGDVSWISQKHLRDRYG